VVSLDVYLVGSPNTTTCRCSECGHVHEHTVHATMYSANITHNLARMADETGIYKALWRPGEMLDLETSGRMSEASKASRWDEVDDLAKLLPVVHAADLIDPLRAGLALLKSDPVRFQAFNAPNGWGMYQHFVSFVEQYLEACQEHPTAVVEVSR
jgi:hypothetical protein